MYYRSCGINTNTFQIQFTCKTRTPPAGFPSGSSTCAIDPEAWHGLVIKPLKSFFLQRLEGEKSLNHFQPTQQKVSVFLPAHLVELIFFPPSAYEAPLCMPEPAAETKVLARKICAGSFFALKKRMAWWLQYWMNYESTTWENCWVQMPPNQTIQIDFPAKGTLRERVCIFFHVGIFDLFDRMWGVILRICNS